MRSSRLLAAAFLLVWTQRAAAQSAPAAIALLRPETQLSASPSADRGSSLEIASSAVPPGGALPKIYSAYGKNISPPLEWSVGPAATQAYVLVLEDPDAGPKPRLHWLAYDIPASVHALSKGVKNTAEPSSPAGMLQGWNDHDSLGYTGMKPPVGAPAHHYHLQIFALDRRLRRPPGDRLDKVVSAMRGHVLARGELVWTFEEPLPRPKSEAR